MIQKAHIDFEHDLEEAVGRLRAALIQIFDEVGLDPGVPQDLSRTLGLNKTLTWNVSRIIRASDHLSALPHIPGEQSINKVLAALARYGASRQSVENTREAAFAFKKMTTAHVGDRSSLDLIVDGMAPASAEGADTSRKLAFRGNSGMYGIQARTRLVSSVVVPNAADPSRLDVAFLTGFVGLRRLRANVQWPIFKLRLKSQPSEESDLWGESGPGDALDCGGPRCFYRHEPPAIKVLHSRSEKDYVLMPGSIGDTAAFDCFKGDVFRAAVPRYRSHPDETGDFGASITVPTEHLVLDLIVHRDLEFALHAKPLTFTTIYAFGEGDRKSDDVSLLPIHQRSVELVSTPPVVATPLVPRYSEFFRTIHERLGVDPALLRGIRVEMKYPPLGSMVVFRYVLPSAPAS